MKLPVQVTFRNFPPSEHVEELETLIRERADHLGTYYPDIMGCRIVLDVPHRHRRDGNHYHVRIDLTVPGDEIVVKHEPTLYASLGDIQREEQTKADDVQPAHKHAAVVVREAFDIARRQLQDYARRQQGRVKGHEAPLHGTVARVGPEEGWIATSDGREVYFHARSVLDGAFGRLAVGSAVAFVEEAGEKGPQASTVRVLGKHHYA
jgi:cold shock CspA family protein